jgi:dTDP-D-glucose 4,6-dehydratase
MKIVIAGALGHIGSAIIRQIPSKLDVTEIVMIDNMMTQRYCSLFNLSAGVKYRFIEYRPAICF